MARTFRFGEWTFSPDAATLVRGSERRRLEHRTSRVLELLCVRAGEPVSRAELVDAVWEGRALSDNSVAVVIADLRRALGDDSRRPRYIETIAKRGYRLAAAIEATAAPLEPVSAARHRARFLLPLLLLLLAGAALAFWAPWRASPAEVAVSVGDFPNQTGSPRYDPLVPAVSQLVATELARLEGVRVVRGGGEAAAVRVHGTIILWTGHAAVALHAVDPRSETVLWSGMAGGPSERLPAQVRTQLEAFGTLVRARRSERGREPRKNSLAAR